MHQTAETLLKCLQVLQSNSMNSSMEPEWEDVLSAPLSAERNGTTFSLTAYVWQDYQPLIITGGALAHKDWELWCELAVPDSAAPTKASPFHASLRGPQHQTSAHMQPDASTRWPLHLAAAPGSTVMLATTAGLTNQSILAAAAASASGQSCAT